ncbi:MAG: N-acetyl-gamma-glutamyl-phosphate reductase [Bacillaceae bacterium]|nr:N-acetyl-gamma-glutamyl-phosphate reductase [Bacillaceae bacterium]
MKVSIIGTTGYGGVELIRFLENHPHAEIATLYANSQEGKWLNEVFPHLTDIRDVKLAAFDLDRIEAESDLVFFGTPSGVSGSMAPALLERGLKVIDLSGDFRLHDPEQYRTWYGKDPADKKWLDQAVYGLSEWAQPSIQQAQLIANPGCYPTATLLALLPLLKKGAIHPRSIIVDAKSGVSGAGRAPSQATHFCETNDSISAYKVGRHQHIPEMEQVLGEWTGQDVLLSFTPHLTPMTRGILATIYADLTQDVTWETIDAWYREVYEDRPFVRLRPQGSHPKTKEVYGSNYCDIAYHVDERTGRVMILSVIDNLVKGAAGQAIQNMNIMMGLPEETGLPKVPVFP